MHKFHSLQCKKISSFRQAIINTLWGSSSSVCDGEHVVLKIHKLLLFDFVFKKHASCNHSLKIFRPGQPYRLSACHLSMQHNHGLTRTVLCLLKNIGVQNRLTSFMFIKPTKIHLKGVWNSSHSKFCRITSCYLVKHNLVMAPKASLTYLPTTQAWRPLASFRPVSRYFPIPVRPGSFFPHWLIVL